MANKSKERTRPERYTARYWNSEISSAEDRHRKFWQKAKESIKTYNRTREVNDEDAQRRISVWWYLVNTLLPAYYSSTPKVEVELRKKAGTMAHQVASTLLERDVQYALDAYFDFDQVGLGAARQLLLVGRNILWARYDVELGEQEVPGGDPVEAKSEESAILDLVQYDDYLESDARTEAEIEWRARRAFLTEDEATELFGGDTAAKLSYDSFPEALKRRDNRKEINLYDGKAELWEIWCEESGQVYWLQKKGEKSILESDAPQIKYEGFYPCSVLNASLDPDSTIPTSDFVHCQDQILEVERLTTRIHAVTQAIRTNFAYDATLGDTINELLRGDLKGVPIKSWPAYKTRGGLANGMEFLQIDAYIKALEVLNNAREQALQHLYEITKASDLLRGVSEPTKTATANRLENAWSSLGLIVRQNEFCKHISSGLEKLGAIICQQFDPERMLDIADAQDLFAAAQGVQPEEVIALLRDPVERCYRIKIASDSMVALDEKQERQDRADLMQSVGGFYQQASAIIEKYPPMAQFALELTQFVLRTYKGGKELEPIFMNAMSQLGPLIQAQSQQAQQTPPTPGVIEAQTRMKIAQIEAQTAQQKSAVEMQQLQFNQQLDQWKAQQDVAIRQEDLKIKANAVQVDLIKVQATTQVDAANLSIQQEMNRLTSIIGQQKVEIDKQHMLLTAHEQALQEQRLQQVELGKKAEKPVLSLKNEGEMKDLSSFVKAHDQRVSELQQHVQALHQANQAQAAQHAQDLATVAAQARRPVVKRHKITKAKDGSLDVQTTEVQQ